MDKNISNFFSKNSQILQVLLLVLVVIAIVYFAKQNSEPMVNHWLGFSQFTPPPLPVSAETQLQPVSEEQVSQSVDAMSSDNDMVSPVDFSGMSGDIRAEDLLPNSKVAGEFSSGPGFVAPDLNAQNFLVSGFAAGIDTQGSSNKNPSYDFRGDIPIPVNLNATPFGQSTITPNPYQRSWEIGGPITIQ